MATKQNFRAMAVLFTAVLCISVFAGSAARAQLTATAGGQAVYDSGKNVTWLANANLATIQTFGVTTINPDGSMDYTTAQNWIAAMNGSAYLGSSQWAMPTTAIPDNSCSQSPKTSSFGYECTGSQLGDLYYNKLGGIKGSTIDLTHNSDFSLFTNFQPYLYWSGTTWTKVANSAFSFSFGNGFQGTNVFVNAMYVIAVAPGKVLNATLPVHPSSRNCGSRPNGYNTCE